MKCAECGQILAADVVRCTNCGIPVNATLVYREVDEPITTPPTAPQPAVVDLTELDVVDLREMIAQLYDEVAVEEPLDATRVATAANTESIRRAWEVHSRNSAILWPQRWDRPRPTTDDITPAR